MSVVRDYKLHTLIDSKSSPKRRVRELNPRFVSEGLFSRQLSAPTTIRGMCDSFLFRMELSKPNAVLQQLIFIVPTGMAPNYNALHNGAYRT